MFFCCSLSSSLCAGSPGTVVRVPILVYHRFGPTVDSSMTVTTPVFESHLKYLRDHDYTVVSVRQLVRYLRGEQASLPPNAVVITADDDHRTVFSDMLPLVRRYRVLVTLFVYPSAISNASYAMTWEQLEELEESGLFDIQSHSFWHPNFHIEKKRLAADEYRKFVNTQLIKSKMILEKKLGAKVDLLSWPFGIYDEELIAAARTAGYVAGFTLERRSASKSDDIMALPRYLMTDRMRGKAFESILSTSHDGREPSRTAR